MSPPAAPGSPAQPTEPGHDAGNGRPRPFFAEPPGEAGPDAPIGQAPPPAAGPGYGEPVSGGPRYGQPTGQFPGQGLPGQGLPGQGQAGQQPDGWPAANRSGQWPAAQRRLSVPSRELRQRAIAALVLGGVSLIALFGLNTDLRKGVYVLGFSALVGLAACVIGISALVKARKTGAYRPRGAIGGIVLGVLGMLISVPILVTYLVFPTQLTNYVNCLSQAQNSTQQKACMNSFYRSINLPANAMKATGSSKP
jgi:hypothetical protein